MDEWGWEQLEPWSAVRLGLPVGPLFCVYQRPEARAAVVSSGRPRRSCAGRRPPRASGAGLRRISSVNAHAVEMALEDVPLIVIERQLGHSNLGITSIYLQGIDNCRDH
jgi:hypothetical protein